MRKLVSLLLVIFLVVNLSVLLAKFAPSAKATYVEGDIRQDTVWMLVDSPFIVINNVTVYPGVALTIEPGVEIRFGGNFSLNILGRLIAKGTKDYPITFTSNRPEGLPGDWIGIIFDEVSESQMDYCVVKYAVNGLTLENSTLEVSNSEFIENEEAGIKIIGNSSLIVDNSRILLNEVGVLPINLNFNSSRQVTLSNTVISSNYYGIYIDGVVNNLNVQNCSLMSNEIALYVAGETNIDFTYNSIAYNDIGVLVGNLSTVPLQIHYNDIYNNTEIAMRLDNSTIMNEQLVVNATYNYWGDSSGPFHPTLNPHGKGNPVNSSGIDIDFIPFLSNSIHYPNSPPIAQLLTDKVIVAPKQEVLFIGTNSSDDGRVDYYLFEFGDGTNSGWTTLSAIKHKYSMTGTYTAKLTVLDDFGTRSNTVNIKINVQNLPALEVIFTLSTSVTGPLKNVSVIVQVKSGGIPIENSSVRLFSIGGGSFVSKSGLTNATGHFVAAFTAPNVTEETNIMLVATASKAGYADGSDYKYVKVLPPLTVNLEVEPKILKSGEEVNVRVYVSHLGQPVQEASIEISSNLTGFFSDSGITDIDGKCVFNFTSPAVKESTSIEITVVASKEGYEDGSASSVIIVEPKIMVAQVSIYPETIFSNENSTIYVYVSYEQWPIEGAQVNITTNLGILSSQMKYTDSYGEAAFVYQAPIVYEKTTAIFNITISKDGYADVTLQSNITIEPKVLTVKIEAFPETVVSERTFNVSVYVTFNGQPVSEASVQVASSFGNFSGIGVTDINGMCMFTFVAPAVNQQINVTIFANASKTGYVSNSSSTLITLKPRILDLEVNINPIVASSGETVILTVHVKCDELDMQDVFVTVTSDFGNFSGYTNSSGLCVFEFEAPQVSTQTTFSLVISASKDGYVDAQGNFYFDVIPTAAPQRGFPWTTFMIIMVVILVIVVIIALLFKLGIIEVSSEEAEES